MSHSNTISAGRKNYIDLARGITMVTILFSHLVPPTSLFSRWILAFNMPFFFLLNGCMLKDTLPPFGEFVVKRVKRLLVPNWIYRIVYYFLVKVALEGTEFTVSNFLFQIFWAHSCSPADWFLPVMFWVSIGMYVYLFLRKKLQNDAFFIFGTLVAVTIMTAFCDLRLFHGTRFLPFRPYSGALGLSFTIVGYWIQKSDLIRHCSSLYQTISKKVLRLAVVAAVLVVYSFLAFYNSHGSHVNMADISVGRNLFSYFISGMMMFLLLIVTGQTLNTNNILLRWLCLLGRHSMLIYLVHYPVNTWISKTIFFLSKGQLELLPFVNLGVTWTIVFFLINAVPLTILCIALERRASKKHS